MADLGNVIRMGTACSGTGSAEEALRSILNRVSQDDDLAEHAKDLNLSVEFMIEKAKFKRQFLSACHAWVFESGGHLFNDVTCVKTGLECVWHKNVQCSSCVDAEAVGRLDVFVAGFSCKSFSGMNPNASASRSLLFDPTPEQMEKSCSLRTFKGVMDAIELSRPKLVVLENVENIATQPQGRQAEQVQQSNVDVVLAGWLRLDMLLMSFGVTPHNMVSHGSASACTSLASTTIQVFLFKKSGLKIVPQSADARSFFKRLKCIASLHSTTFSTQRMTELKMNFRRGRLRKKGNKRKKRKRAPRKRKIANGPVLTWLWLSNWVLYGPSTVHRFCWSLHGLPRLPVGSRSW